ncbi:MAG: hypothetical protein K0Q55_2518, partial [Verrucomicrobia bacterium]|nr:hypothetical protein [Verrucomicrobiota bacterium]
LQFFLEIENDLGVGGLIVILENMHGTALLQQDHEVGAGQGDKFHGALELELGKGALGAVGRRRFSSADDAGGGPREAFLW